MKPEKALELVNRYGVLTKVIKDAKREIGENLSNCKGISGNRLVADPFRHVEVDAKNREIDLHLVQWYTPYRDGWGSVEWEEIDADGQGQECPHCYAAHLAVQKRKEAKKQLGSVKRSMTRSIA
jgi:hypothetical protein